MGPSETSQRAGAVEDGWSLRQAKVQSRGPLGVIWQPVGIRGKSGDRSKLRTGKPPRAKEN